MYEELIELVDLDKDELLAIWSESDPVNLQASFSQYQQTIERFAVYPEVGTGESIALAYCGLGLSGESGEVNENLKKALRDDGGEVTAERRENLKKELGDVLWYLTRLATELGLSMEEVALSNVEKLQDRIDRNVIHGSGDNR